MPEANGNETGPQHSGEKSFQIAPPAISLPKGGGAIRGIGEKFTANPVTGTGTLSVPIRTSPGRGGFGPQLALSYDSGAGNGPFGLGWALALPAIARKTEKGLPQYLDREQSDVFVLSGSEDLVPVLSMQSGEWRGSSQEQGLHGQRYQVNVFRPRVEGLFARIERWTNKINGADVFWRSITRENVTTWYGKTGESRIADPVDPSRIFSWLICETHDDKGNVILFEYQPDDGRGCDTGAEWETHRTSAARSAQRYLKRVRYGNRAPYFPNLHPRDPATRLPDDWMFELVFDFGDHDPVAPGPEPDREWRARPDPFSDYRAGFERRTSRLVERALMFHRFPEVPEVGPAGLVGSMRFYYVNAGASEDPERPGYSHIDAIESWAHELQVGGHLESRQTPPLEFRYSRPLIDPTVRSLAAADLEGLPVGTQGPGYQWVDLDGEGLSGILAEDAGAWRYAANLGDGHFAPSRVVATMPAHRALLSGQRLMDLNGNGEIDVVEFDGPTPGLYEREAGQDWNAFVPFAALPRIRWDDPNLRFVDLTGDGHADALVTEDEVFTWYPSKAEQGFGAAETTHAPSSDGTIRLVFHDGIDTLFLADMCGDGLTDLVRIRNGEVCYWPNLGYGRFGEKVSMGRAPRLDHDEHFDPRRLRLADIDGSGPTDMLYLGRQGVQIYFNRSGNYWSNEKVIEFPLATHNLDAVQATDLLGRGTACLVWNSHLPADQAQPVRYIDLMSGGKPHLLIETRNNLGGSTELEYRSSTLYYLADKAAGTTWITRLPFPVQCVSKVTVRDQWRGTSFSSTYSYHHGYYDGIEREFRGFGRVEQIDVEGYGSFEAGNLGSPWITEDRRLYQPPIKTVTWFHTGVAMDRRRLLTHLEGEYFPACYEFDDQFHERALPEPLLDEGLDADEWREALRACKGMTLRQEIYELDVDALTGASQQQRPVRIYSAATHNCRIQRLQPRGANRHAVFLVTESEALTYQYEQPLPELGGHVRPDPRIAHTLTLRVDELGHPLQTIAVGYPRVRHHEDSALDEAAINLIRAVQNERQVAYTEVRYTSDVVMSATSELDAAVKHHRLRMPYESLSFEVTGIIPDDPFYFRPEDFAALQLSEHYPSLDETAMTRVVTLLPYHRIADGETAQRRLVEQVRALYFDDASEINAPASPLPRGRHGPRGLKYEDYKLALTSDLLAAIFVSPASLPSLPADMLDWELHPGVSARSLLDEPLRSGYQRDPDMGEYWIRSGIAGFADDTARHFFLPERFTDPFGAMTTLEYDPLNLYVRSVTDARGNRTEVMRFDHRVLAPVEMVDVNGNHTEASLDILGQVIAVAAKGKNASDGWDGDDLDAFRADAALRNSSTADVQTFCTASVLDEAQARRWLSRASSRFVYHFGEVRAADGTVTVWATRPAMACAIAREVHASQSGGETSPLQVALECSDGSGNVLMKKVQAEPEIEGGPLRWIVNGLTVLNNKGKPVKQYEPFFSERFGCEMPREEGVTPILFYDAAGRVVRTDLPDGTYTKVEFTPWRTRQFDAGDTVLDSAWYAERGSPDPTVPLPRGIDGTLAFSPDVRAAWLAAKSADTPGQTYLDSLGREVIAIAHNRTPDEAARPTIEWSVGDWGWRDEFQLTHTRLDAEGKPLWVRDARGNLVMQYIHPPKPEDDHSDEVPRDSVPTYDIAGNLLFQHSMDAGERWSLNDAAGKPFLAWDFNDVLDTEGAPHLEARLAHTEYDRLHRPLQQWLRLGSMPAAIVERFEYRDSDHLSAAESRDRNLIGQAVLHDDPGGRIEVLRKSFTGHVQHERRRLARHTTSRILDWQGSEDDRAARLESESFSRQTRHDALGRMTLLGNWHRRSEHVAVYKPIYNQRGVLAAEDFSVSARWNDGNPTGGRTWRAVHGIAYNAKGQRIRLRHGNGTETRYAYDPRTFRLVQLRSTRPATDLPFPGFHSHLSDDRVVQQLHYTYDVAGNITEIEDEAWTPVFFRNQAVEPRSLYVYDAIGRLIEATGRESADLVGSPASIADPTRVDDFPAEHELRNYRQRYEYDVVGNFITLQHGAGGGSWTRHYETAMASNRLLRTWTGSDDREAVRYGYDSHGSTLNLATVPASARIQWDWRDMIEEMDLGGGGRAWYAYDIAKQRTRKRIERLTGAVEERLYLGGMELYRRYAPSGSLIEEIETQHLFVDDQRVLLVDDVITTDNDTLGTGVLMRYQYGNHLGSVALELDETAQIVGCEEFHPYGTTAYHLVNRLVRASAKRYRYTGMERDEETGLSYHTARHYVPWLGRWGSVDPIGLEGGGNSYAYSHDDPIGLLDMSGTQSTDCEFDMCFSLEEVPEPDPGSDFVTIEDNLLVQPVIEDGEITGLLFSDVVAVDLPTLDAFLHANEENDQTRAVLTEYWRQHHPRGVSLYSESVIGPFRHAFLRVTTDEGDFVVEIGDAEGRGERTADPGLAYWEAHPETYTFHEGAITRPADPSADAQFEERLLDLSAYFSQQDETGDYVNLPTYSVLGPNSNGYVRYVIESAGGEVVMDAFLFPANDVTQPYSESPSDREERLRQLREEAREISENMSVLGFPL